MATDPLAAIGGIPATPQQDPLAAIGGIPDTASSTVAAPLSRSAEANQVAFHTPFVPESVAPPQDHKEELVKNIAGDRGLTSYRAAREAVMHVENLIKAPAGAYDAAKQYVQSIPDTIKKAVMPEPQDLDPTHHIVNANPIAPMPGVGAAAGEFAAAPVEASVAKTLLKNPFRGLIAGVKAGQEPAEAAVRGAVGAAETTPILSGAETVIDEPLAKIGAAKDAAYKQIDDIVGFNLKAERQKLSDTQYAIKQPGADVPKLQAEIDASTKQIADANAKLAKARIDPKTADRLNTSWEATKGLKNDIVKSTASDGTINVKQLLTRSKNARFNARYGDRLAQAFGQGDSTAGKPIADAYVQGLEAAQKAGIQGAHARELAKYIGTKAAQALGIAGVLGAGGYAASTMIPH